MSPKTSQVRVLTQRVNGVVGLIGTKRLVAALGFLRQQPFDTEERVTCERNGYHRLVGLLLVLDGERKEGGVRLGRAGTAQKEIDCKLTSALLALASRFCCLRASSACRCASTSAYSWFHCTTQAKPHAIVFLKKREARHTCLHASSGRLGSSSLMILCERFNQHNMPCSCRINKSVLERRMMDFATMAADARK